MIKDFFQWGSHPLNNTLICYTPLSVKSTLADNTSLTNSHYNALSPLNAQVHEDTIYISWGKTKAKI